MKRVLSLIICAVVLVLSIPFVAFAEKEKYAEITIIPDVYLPENSELFAGYVEQAFYLDQAASPKGTSARDKLSEADKHFYDWLKENAINIANGTQTSTYFTADTTLLSTWTGVETTFSFNLMEEFFAQFNSVNIMTALLNDCPYEFYWFDKTTGYRMGISYIGNTVVEVHVIFDVSVGYRAANYDENDPKVSVGSTVSAAVATAKAIVNKYAEYSDYKKLIAYRDEICALTDYNHEAAGWFNPDYGDPWQLIHVFDKNPSTKVVCEGYAKAFKYLCDMTTFENPGIACNIVMGTADGGPHMWNVVTMDDGKNYFADVTNSEEGTVGEFGGLFLNGFSGSIASGYIANLPSKVVFIYNEETKMLWGTDTASILNISASDYVPPLPQIVLTATNKKYNGKALTAGASNADVVYKIKNDNTNDYSFAVAWYKDNNGSIGKKLASAPVDEGTYWIAVTATHKTNGTSFSASVQVSITPPVAKGDIDASGNIDSMDYLFLKRAYFSQYKLTDKSIGDIDGNGNIESMDYLFLKRAYFNQYTIKNN